MGVLMEIKEAWKGDLKRSTYSHPPVEILKISKHDYQYCD